jgi:geranylgeranyl reductase family protein
VSGTRSVVIAGGGPAGSAAAITLARAGVDVTLVDRARFPREKCCGDGLTTGGLRRLEDLGLDPDTVRSFTPVDTLWASSPSGRIVEVPLAGGPGTYAAVARRADLDSALVALARQHGARVIEGDGIVDLRIESGDAGVTAVLGSGTEIPAEMCFGADGARSTVRRVLRSAAGVPKSQAMALAGRDAWFAFRQYAASVTERAAEQLWVRFEPGLLPGYGWSFPLGGGRANVGIGLPRTPGTSGGALRAAWRTTLGSPFFSSLLGADAVLEGELRAWPIPTGVRREDLVGAGGRVLFLGDAAGAADPFTGEGIAQALETGACAARAVLDAGREGAATSYVRAVGASLFTEQRISRLARAALASQIGARGALRATAHGPRVARFVGRWLYEEFPRAALATPQAWPEALAPRPGPYAGRAQA